LNIKSRNKRVLNICLIGCLIFGLIFSNNAMADTSNKPDFDLELSVTKSEVVIGEDIIINGRIIPKPFETEVPAKEIVLVLDVSGSMNDKVLCDMDRVRYCTWHNTSVTGHEGKNHKWVDNYCVEHKKSGNHNSTKITELKKAANNFIDKMKDVPNLKIGIVTYSKEAEIKRDTKKALIPASNVDGLKKIINELNADGGTNTGEGLRKATYLLNSNAENDKSAIKTVVLMSDGMATYRTVNGNSSNSNSNNLYLNTDIENREMNTSIAGNGRLDDGENNTKYAMAIGGIIDIKNYNVFSIGYGMDSTGTNKLIEIHKAMSGLINVENNLIDKEKGFFSTSDGAINSVFDQIADEILDSYPINNIDLNITFNSGFSLNIGGNTVRLDTVNYKKTSESQNGKIRYEAESVPFQFIVKGSEPGNKDINSNLNITFPWKDNMENLTFDKKLNINIKPNELPPISAKLISDEKVESESGQVVNLKYQIEADDFVFQDSTNVISNDVVIVLDINKDMTQNKLQQIENALFNKIINIEALRKNNTKYAVVTFSNVAKKRIDLTSNTTYLNDNIIKKIEVEGDGNNVKNIGETFPIIIGILENENENARPDARKNVIFISEGNVNYNNIELLKNKGYNIISLETNFRKENSLHNMHSDLGALGENYFNTNGDNNLIENNIMAQIADRIINSKNYRPYDISTKLHFNLDDNFNAIEGVEVQDNNNMIVNVPNIRYNHVGNGKYVAEEIVPVEFSIMVKENRVGDLTFGQNPELNKIAYKSLVNRDINIPIRTPIINVQEKVSNLAHGLYGGIKNNIVDIIGNGNRIEIVSGSNVTFGAKFIVGGNSTKFNINIDPKLEEISLNNIKVYKTVMEDSKLELKELKADIIGDDIGKNINIIINNINENNTSGISIKSEIVVVYTGKVNEKSINEGFTNTIRFSNQIFKDVNIFTSEKDLPDLF